jgi:solute carrier family 25 (mitochondrial phosphate transporter), member 23/24/25/41
MDIRACLTDELDTSLDKKLSALELRTALRDLGYDLISDQEVQTLFDSINASASGKISFAEFRRFVGFLPQVNVRAMFEQWHNVSSFDAAGELLLVSPPETEAAKRERKESASVMVISEQFRVLIAGAMAGAISRTLTAPLDRAKVLLQAGQGVGSPVAVLQRVIREEGFRALFRGNGVNCLKIAPESAFRFFFYDRIKAGIVGSETAVPTTAQRFIAGSMAGMLSSMLLYPLEASKTLLSISKPGTYRGLRHVLWETSTHGTGTLQLSGLRRLYRGMFPTLLGIIPYSGIDLTLYNIMKERMSERYAQQGHRLESPPVWIFLGCGAASSTIAAVTIYPMQVVRVRMQSSILQAASTTPPTIRSTASDIYQRQGWRGLYRGMGAGLMKSVPAISISYACFESVKKLL